MEKSLDPQLWNACAGSMVQLPSIGTHVFYFPQGHAEHAYTNVDFSTFPKLPSMFLCRVSYIHYLADSDSDEVFAKIKLIPLRYNSDDREIGGKVVDEQHKPASFAKTLTQSDANNGGGFSVPRYCAETIFPKLDYSADPPVQTILAKDVHGEIWKFRHIYRGTPRRHLLTTGWSNFVNHKKLIAGDSIVFLRSQTGELCVGVRRAKRGINETEPQFGWKVKAESVAEAVRLALAYKPFEIVYYPRACTPEYCVKASVVTEAIQIPWCSGTRFKMPFETEDSSRISWFMGTVFAAHVADHFRWPNSPWRLLQVAWDEPELLQNVKRVSPWLVEVVSNMTNIHLTSFCPPRKKLRFPLVGGQFPPLPSQNPEFEFQSSVGHFPGNFFRTNSRFSSGLQGARHGGDQFGLSSSDLHFRTLQSGLLPVEFQQLSKRPRYERSVDGNRSRLLTMGRNVKAPVFVLFGQAIHTAEQMSHSQTQTSSDETLYNTSSDGVQEMVGNTSNATTHLNRNSCSDGGSPCQKDQLLTELKLETGHSNRPLLGCSMLSSYDELHSKLTHMFRGNVDVVE